MAKAPAKKKSCENILPLFQAIPAIDVYFRKSIVLE